MAWNHDDPETMGAYRLYRKYKQEGLRVETLIRVQARNMGITPEALKWRFRVLKREENIVHSTYIAEAQSMS